VFLAERVLRFSLGKVLMGACRQLNDTVSGIAARPSVIARKHAAMHTRGDATWPCHPHEPACHCPDSHAAVPLCRCGPGRFRQPAGAAARRPARDAAAGRLVLLHRDRAGIRPHRTAPRAQPRTRWAGPRAGVWRKHAAGPMGAHIWAPELHHIDGKWYLYFTAGRADAPIWDIRLYVLENARREPAGRRVDRARPVEDRLGIVRARRHHVRAGRPALPAVDAAPERGRRST
jgi:hypothetical protein